MKKNTTGDNFSFDFGGSDEFFPLNNAKSDKSQPPVGVKGYLKNVTKSVFGLGVKVHKHLLPELDTLVTSTKEDVGEISSEMSVKATIKNVKEKLKTYGKLGVDTGKSIFQDAKTAIKTGDFLGSDAVDDEFGDMFGDIGELSDGDSFDFGYGTDDSDDDYSSDDSSFPETGTTKAVIKSSYASTKAAAKMSNRQIATTVGAAQSQIKHQSLMFSQQMELSQYQHQAKMRVMRNIGINVGKLIDQNNISLKAQMEYSAKSLDRKSTRLNSSH